MVKNKKGSSMLFFEKMKGGKRGPSRVGYSEIAWSWIGAFLGIAPVAFISSYLFHDSDLVFIVGSFGASAVLIYGAVRSPLAQPRNLVGGHILSAFIGVLAYKLFYPFPWFAAAFAVATAIGLMHATGTLHPPGGATALIAVIGGEKVHALGFLYVLVPIALGVAIMLFVALVVNNLAKNRRYPEYWY